jgi:hypothetical protein
MRTLLPTIAATCALIAVPATAPAQSAGQHGGSHWSAQNQFSTSQRHGDGRHDRRDRMPRGDVALVTVPQIYGGEWALHNNRSWAADSYNDWWHDRPDRAYPRWTRTNQNCERIWWSGSGWRC